MNEFWNLIDIGPLEFKADIKSVDIEALKKILKEPSTTPTMWVETKGHELTQKRLHKKKRIAKKWAKQGKYKAILVARKFEVKDIKEFKDGDATEVTMGCINTGTK